MGALSLSRLRRGFASPNLFLREANRLYHRRLYTRPYNTDGVDVFAEDWDNLLILDACRYDMFETQSSLPGRLESRISRGSNTVEFLTANVQGRSLHDTVYVTANPQLYRHRDWLDASFHAVEDVWKTDGWDETRRTVLPETLAERALDIAAEYPNKRLVVHFVQPHYPFITDEENPLDDEQAFLRPDEPGSWYQVMTGQLNADTDAVWRAYRRNLDRALPHVEELLDALGGRSVVTADHGNMIGERARPVPVTEWGHPGGIYTEELVNIPWLVVDGDRRDVVAEEPRERETETTDEQTRERLRSLGYVE
jgi:hypothetical protein